MLRAARISSTLFLVSRRSPTQPIVANAASPIVPKPPELSHVPASLTRRGGVISVVLTEAQFFPIDHDIAAHCGKHLGLESRVDHAYRDPPVAFHELDVVPPKATRRTPHQENMALLDPCIVFTHKHPVAGFGINRLARTMA